MRTLTSSVALLLALSAAGCSLLVDPESNDPAKTAEGFCNSIQDALVGLHCGGVSDAYMEQLFGHLRAGCDTLQSAVDEGRLAYDSGQAAACIDAVERLGCRGLLGATTAFEWPQPCRAALRGGVAEGGACTYQNGVSAPNQGTAGYRIEECAEGTGCYTTTASTCGGTCQSPAALGQSCYGGRPCQGGLVCSYGAGYTCQRGTSGDVCGGSSSDCAAGFYCSSTAAGTCQPLPSSGACYAGFLCDETSYCSGGSCQPRVGIGADCATAQCQQGLVCYYLATSQCRSFAPEGGDCSSTYCDYYSPVPLYCDQSKVCRRYPTEPLTRGADCSGLGTSYCADGLFCDTYPLVGPINTCQPQFGPGEDCSISGYEVCLPGTTCYYDSMALPPTSTCRSLLGVGAACNTMSAVPCELGLFCRTDGPITAGVCDALPTDGEPCASGGPAMGCAPGHYMSYPPPSLSCVCARYKAVGATCAMDDECGYVQTGRRCVAGATGPATCQEQYACELPIGWLSVGI